MTFEKFELIIDDCFKELKALSATKGTEYANSADRLANFKRVAGDVEITPIKAAWVYFRKHLDAINYVIKGKKERSESFKSRIYDAILYLLLIYAIHVETSETPTVRPYFGATENPTAQDITPVDAQGRSNVYPQPK